MATTPQEPPATPPKTILIVRLSAIGDVVCTLPLLEVLRGAFPLAQIDWVVEPKAADLLLGHPYLRNVLLFPRKGWSRRFAAPLRTYLRNLNSRVYDVALDAQGNFKSALNMHYVRARRKIGFARGHVHDGSWLFVRERVVPPGKRIHRVEKYLSLLGPLGVSPPGRPLSPPPIDPTAATRVEKFLEREKLTDRELALLHPATSTWGRDKQWPPERFGTLARKLAEELGLVPIITWGPGEKRLAEQTASLSHARARVAFETKSLKEFVALISKSHLFVAGDTGALQIASFLGRPTVGIFGPTDPVVYGPIGPRSVVAQPPDLLEPPKRSQATRAKRSTLMEQISVEQVFQLCRGLLETKG